jgi:hypothetical protein
VSIRNGTDISLTVWREVSGGRPEFRLAPGDTGTFKIGVCGDGFPYRFKALNDSGQAVLCRTYTVGELRQANWTIELTRDDGGCE